MPFTLALLMFAVLGPSTAIVTQARGAATTPTAVDVDEYRVYGAVVDQMFSKGSGRMLISDHTLSFNCRDSVITVDVGGCAGGMRLPDVPPGVALQSLAGRLADVQPSAVEDFGAKNSGGTTLTRDIEARRKYEMGSPSESKATVAPDFWLLFSRVGLSRDRRQALVFVAALSWLPSTPSTGSIVLLRSTDGKWAVGQAVQVWQLGR